MKDSIIWTGDEVISMSAQMSFSHGNMMRFQAIDQSIQCSIAANFPNYSLWTAGRVPAEVLQPGKDWQKGRLKLVIPYHVEFIPDQVPGLLSPLDDLRSQLDTQ